MSRSFRRETVQLLPFRQKIQFWLHGCTQHHRRHIHCTPVKEKVCAVNKTLYMDFDDLEKAFNCVPRRVIWWALCKLGVDKWLVRLKQNTYDDARSRVHVGYKLSEEFSVKLGTHQGSCRSPLPFIMFLEALSQEFRNWISPGKPVCR